MNQTFSKISRTTHWVSSALGMTSLIFFSITGITLNHPDWFKADVQVESFEIVQSENWLEDFIAANDVDKLAQLTHTVDTEWQLPVPRRIEKDEFEWVLDYQRPGGVSTVVLDLETGVMSLERVNDGVIALINDLHKGRHSGLAWRWFIDVAAVICLLFSITGLFLLFVYARKRASTWPLVFLGSLLPLILFWIFVP